MFGVLAFAATLTAAQPAEAAPALSRRVITDPNALRDLAKSLAKSPLEPAPPVRFRLELPLVNDDNTDISDLQNSAGWRVDGRLFVINFDMGVVTPQNFKAFEKDGLFDAPPLRVMYFWTRRSRAQTYRGVPVPRANDVSITQGWYESAESYGLAVATSAEARGVSGGDLPDDFALPFAIKFPLPPKPPGVVAASLRVRVEGELRAMRGHSVLCADQGNGAGYAVDQFTQKTPYSIDVHQCLLPAVIRRISLVWVAGGPPLKVWTRGDRPATAETEATRVRTQRDQRLFVPAPAVTDTSPNSTPPLPKRSPEG